MKGIIFKKKNLTSRFLDPRQGFQPVDINCQVRFDPLTGETGRIAHMGAVKFQKPDLSLWDSEEFRQNCPFCPENIEHVTPKFPPEVIPEGRLRRGEASVIPNISPYDAFSALVILSRDHLVTLEQFTAQLLYDAFSVARDFCHRVKEYDPQIPYFLLGWNYMPPSGGSHVHPHIQIFATHFPGNLYNREMEASLRYFEKNGRSFWEDFIAVEQQREERYIGSMGSAHWLTSFMPRGMMGEVMAVWTNLYTIWELGTEEIDSLIAGLQRIFRFFNAQGIYSFNMVLFSGASGQEHFPIHLRLIPRTYLHPEIKPPDANMLQMLFQESISVVYPEELCTWIKLYFEDPNS